MLPSRGAIAGQHAVQSTAARAGPAIVDHRSVRRGKRTATTEESADAPKRPAVGTTAADVVATAGQSTPMRGIGVRHAGLAIDDRIPTTTSTQTSRGKKRPATTSTDEPSTSTGITHSESSLFTYLFI